MSESTTTPVDTGTRTHLLSSTSTLFWRLFVPVFGTVMFVVMALVFWSLPEAELYLSFPAMYARMAVTALLAAWLLLVWRTVLRLYRVDATAEHVYITNYWKTIRYAWTDVDHCSESRRLGRRIGHIHLKGAGLFGQKISFLPTANFDPQLYPTQQI